MIQIKTKLRRWGNSFGVVVPLKAIEQEKTKEGDEVVLLFKRQEDNLLKDIFGTHKFSKPTDKLLKEVDKELEDEQ